MGEYRRFTTLAFQDAQAVATAATARWAGEEAPEEEDGAGGTQGEEVVEEVKDDEADKAETDLPPQVVRFLIPGHNSTTEAYSPDPYYPV